MEPVMTKPALHTFLNVVFPQVADQFRVDRVATNEIDVTLLVNESHLRPGGTVSGPSMFALADVAIYLAIMAMIGPKALAVTTSASIDFMRKPEAGKNLTAKVRLLKLGKSLAIGDALIFSEGSDKSVARANMTYSIPPAGSASDVTL
ncbi:MAG: PaaI family thioesterase [Planktomarina sp.]